MHDSLISSAIDIYVYKDKLQFALWNKCEEYISIKQSVLIQIIDLQTLYNIKHIQIF